MDRGEPLTLRDRLVYLLERADWYQHQLSDASGVSTAMIGHIVNGVVRAEHGPGRGPNRSTRTSLIRALAERFDQMVEDRTLTWEEAGELKEYARHLLTARQGPAAVPPEAEPSPPFVVPSYLTPLVGRADEVARADALLRRSEVRLLTLTGPPGLGKTRLGVAVATHARDLYAGGVYTVLLAPLRAPELVMPTVARALGLGEEPGRPVLDTLADYLRERRALLLLDNMEHVAAAALEVLDLLAACPGLTALATSRAALRVDGEQELPVPPLRSPDPARSSPEDVAGYPAVDLFVQRARAVAPDFALTPANAPAVAALCRRLDGLPLAIELAAARIKLLPPGKLLDRLDDRLQLLAGGAPHLPERRQSLRGALDWSYDLLTPGERALFRRLAVFAGGCTLEAAEAVCAAPEPLPLTVLDGLASLVDKSLARAEGDIDGEGEGAPRFGMLETMRAYGLDRLEAAGETAAARDGHAAYYLALAEAAEPGLTGAEQAQWLKWLEVEHDNLQGALGWARDGGDVEMGLRLAGAMWRFWETRGYMDEGRRWLDTLLAESEGSNGAPVAADVQAKALNGAGMLALHQGDHARATALHEEGLARARARGDVPGVAAALNNLALSAYRQGDYARATGLFEECLTYRREANDGVATAMALNNLAVVAELQGGYSRALALQEESLTLRRGAGHKAGIAGSTNNLGTLAYQVGDLERAERLLQESLTLQRELEHKRGIAVSLNTLGLVAYQRGNYHGAWSLLQESLALYRDLGDADGIAGVLVNLGAIACAQADLGRAAALYQESAALSVTAGAKGRVLECLDGLAQLAGAAGQAQGGRRTPTRCGGLPARRPGRAAPACRSARLRAGRGLYPRSIGRRGVHSGMARGAVAVAREGYRRRPGRLPPLPILISDGVHAPRGARRRGHRAPRGRSAQSNSKMAGRTVAADNHRPSPIAHRPSPIAHRPSPIAQPCILPS